ncbi:MAG TPA: pilus assembly protein CpaE, partial [Kineosporiaceae bacterium]|nr:pilus assembly protein CpaE [Kineosporiaceae bacterium]
DLALALRDAGLRWTPAPGDRFVLPGRGMDEEVFVLSDMTVEVHDFPSGKVIGFNGVTEWALDSVEQSEAVWLPAEHQLRDLLGGMFASLVSASEGFAVTVRLPSGDETFTADRADDAYATALLAVLRDVASPTAEEAAPRVR